MKVPAVPALLLALLASACASPSRHQVRIPVDLGPGGRVEGRMPLAGIELPDLRLFNRGPGLVDHVVRTPSGRVLSDGPLDRLHLVYDDASCAEGAAIVVLEAREGAGASVVVVASGIGGAGVEWDLSRAHPEGAPPPKAEDAPPPKP